MATATVSGFRKTAAMAVIELQDAALRNGARRDIREIIGERFLEEGTLRGAAIAVEVDHSTLSTWVRDHLRGEIVSHDVTVLKLAATKGLFTAVVAPGSRAEASLVLEGQLTQLESAPPDGEALAAEIQKFLRERPH